MSTATMTSINPVEPTFKQAATVWWALFWRAILFAGGTGYAVGLVESFLGTRAGLEINTILYLGLVSTAIVCVPVGIFVVQLVLRKHFREFTIRLIPTGSAK